MKLRDGRVAPPLDPLFNINCNQWSLYDPAGTYFLPVNDLTWIYLNGVLEIFNETTSAFIVDERAGFRPAGLGALPAPGEATCSTNAARGTSHHSAAGRPGHRIRLRGNRA